MLFNSIQFLIFFIIVYSLYLVFNHKRQNRLLLVASCIFYGAWDWRFLFLMFISITTDFFCAKYIHQTSDDKVRKRLLVLNFSVNLGILGFFKYFNFFAENLQALLHTFGFSININFLHIILPVGISFYTFQAMSYAFDVYRRQLVPAKNFLDYALFVTYFPQLVAGPIERASHLLPQILTLRQVTLDKFYKGCCLILWGLFQKIFIADNLAKMVDPVFSSSPPYAGASVLLALYAFAFQIYCDFAGYSNIARGLGKCMGFDIMINFRQPYFATNPQEFWNRWHISLSSWLKDYLYIPLGGNRKGKLNMYRNLAVTMLLGGLWHGAQWTFVLWGAYQGGLLIVYKLFHSIPFKRHYPQNYFGKMFLSSIKVIFFFNLICLGWLLFRANSITQILEMLRSIFFNFHMVPAINKIMLLRIIFFTWLLFIIDLIQFKYDSDTYMLKLPTPIRWSFYLIVTFLLINFMCVEITPFIYFQF